MSAQEESIAQMVYDGIVAAAESVGEEGAARLSRWADLSIDAKTALAAPLAQMTIDVVRVATMLGASDGE